MNFNLSIDSTLSKPAYQQIADQIRSQIEMARLQDGQPLPTNRELQEALGVNYKVAQRAYDELAKEGMVSRRRRVGTVVKAPRRRKRNLVGIVTNLNIYDPHTSYFYSAAIAAMVNLLQKQEFCHRLYVSVVTDHGYSSAYSDVDRDLRDGDLAGLVLLDYDGKGTPLLLKEAQQVSVPVLGLYSSPNIQYQVYTSNLDIARMGLGYLSAQGCKRIAVVFAGNAHQYKTKSNAILSLLREYSCVDDPNMIIGIRASFEGGYQAAAHIHPNAYDAVLVTDDVTAVGVERYFAEHGIRVPQDIVGVVHWNSRTNLSLRMPFVKVYCDVDRIAEEAVLMMSDLIHGRKIADPIRIVQPSFASFAKEDSLRVDEFSGNMAGMGWH